MILDNADFYPTPRKIIEKMLYGIDFNFINSILEPSAGSGNIVDVLEEKNKIRYGGKRYSYSIDCIEKDADLRSILKGKNHRVIYNDFMSFDTYKEYDLIIMNPPFSNGAKHLLKAIEMQEKTGGKTVCLLNAETLRNPYTNERKMLAVKLEKYNASIEYIKEAFSTSETERKTDVDVALVKVDFPKPEKHDSFILENLRKAKKENETNERTYDNQIAENDFLKAIVSQYKMEVEAGIRLISEYEAMKPFICGAFIKDKKTGEVKKEGCLLSLDISTNRDRYRSELSTNNYVVAVRKKYWKTLFENPKFTGKLTENLKKEFYNKVEELKDYDFSLYNIYQIKADIQKSVIKGIEDTIIDLFEELSNKYHYLDETSRNIHYYNGWKTNKSWIINKKVIIPLNAFDTWSGEFRCDYRIREKLKDIEKCFNFLDGGITEAVDIDEALSFAEEFGETKNIQLKYFTVTFYKKGTCHMSFCDEELLKKFNIFGSQHKGWLPPSYGKKKYEDMTREEKSVIDDFEGRDSYKDTLHNKNYYLTDVKVLMLEQ